MVLVLVAALAAQLPADVTPREPDSLSAPRARLAEVYAQLSDLRAQRYDTGWPVMGILFGIVPAVVGGIVVGAGGKGSISTAQAVVGLMAVSLTVSLEIFSIVALVKNKISAVVRDARMSSLSIERSVIEREIESQQQKAPPPPPPPPLVPATL